MVSAVRTTFTTHDHPYQLRRPAFRAHILAAQPAPTQQILQRAIERGQARSSAGGPQVAMVGPALVRDHFLLHGAPIPESVLADIVDNTVLPLVTP